MTGNADSVTLNAYASNNSNASKLRGSGCDSVLLRTPRFVNDANHRKNVWFVVKNIVFAKMMVEGMRGIVKIPSRKVRSFYTVETMLKLAHHFLSTLKNVDNVQNSGTEFNTFNPFVVGSTPAGPTKIKLKTPRTKVRGVFFVRARQLKHSVSTLSSTLFVVVAKCQPSNAHPKNKLLAV